MSVDNRTRALVKSLQRVTDVKITISRVEELSFHLLEFPETRGVAVTVRHVILYYLLCLYSEVSFIKLNILFPPHCF